MRPRCSARDARGHLCELTDGHEGYAHTATLHGIAHMWDWDGDQAAPNAVTPWVGLLDCGHRTSGVSGSPPGAGRGWDCGLCGVTATLIDVIEGSPRPA